MNNVNWNGYKQLLIPLGHKSDVNNLTSFASLVVDKDEGKVNFVHVIKEGTYSQLPREWRSGSKRVVDSYHSMVKKGISSNKKIITSDSVISGILNEVDELQADSIMLGWGPKPQSSISKFVSQILKKAECEVIVHKTRGESEDIDKILYPIALEPDMSRLKLISRIIQDTDATLSFVHVNIEDNKNGKELIEKAKSKSDQLNLAAEYNIVDGDDVSKVLSTLSVNYDLMILGPSKGWWLHQTLFGRTTDKIARNSDCSVLLHKVAESEE